MISSSDLLAQSMTGQRLLESLENSLNDEPHQSIGDFIENFNNAVFDGGSNNFIFTPGVVVGTFFLIITWISERMDKEDKATFNDFVNQFNNEYGNKRGAIEYIIDTVKDSDKDKPILCCVIKHLRNSLSHHRFEVDTKDSKFTFYDKYPKDNTYNFKMKLNLHSLYLLQEALIYHYFVKLSNN